MGFYRFVCLCHAFLFKFELSLRAVFRTYFFLFMSITNLANSDRLSFCNVFCANFNAKSNTFTCIHFFFVFVKFLFFYIFSFLLLFNFEPPPPPPPPPSNVNFIFNSNVTALSF